MENFNNIKSLNKPKGDAGETIACAFLEQNGFKIIKQNYRSKHKEIDIIATKVEKLNEIYHFIEVKMRSNSSFGSGREAVNRQKQKSIRSAAQDYLLEAKLYDKVYSSFDVIEISGYFNNCQIEYLENCF